MRFWVKRYHLAVLLAAVMVKQVILIGLMPIWQGFDEPAHFQYTQTIVEDRRLPVFQPNAMHFSREVWTSYVGVSKQLSKRFNLYPPIPEYQYQFSSNERHSVTPGMTPTNVAALYGPLYYALEAVPYVLGREHSLTTRLTAMRLFSSLWLVVTVWLAYRLIRRLRGAVAPALSIATMVGFFPMLGYVSAGVNNDIFLIMLVTLALERSASWWSSSPSRQQLVMIGAITGLAAMTKQSGLLAIPLVTIIFFVTQRRWGWVGAIKRFFWLVIPAAVLGFSWTVWSLVVGSNFIVSAGPDRFAIHEKLTPGLILFYDLIYRPKDVWVSGWGQFGWNQFFLSYAPAVYVVAVVVTGVAVVGLWQVFRRRVGASAWRSWLTINLISLGLLEIGYQALYWQRALSQNVIRFPNQGRYYFLLIVPLLALLFAGLEKFVAERHRKWVWIGLSGLMMILTIWSMQILWAAFSTIH